MNSNCVIGAWRVGRIAASAFALVSTLPAVAGDNALVCGGFETCQQVPGFPTTFGVWGTDVLDITGPQQGISPLEGSHMLQFVCTFMAPPCHQGGATGSDTQQLVDLSPFADLVDSGDAVATLTAWFNRVSGDLQTDTKFFTSINAYAGSPANYPTIGGSPLAHADGFILSDGDVGTWEPLTVVLAIPANADFLAVDLSAIENIFDDATAPSFDGHYADMATLTIGPACPADLTGDDSVDGADLGLLLGAWGTGDAAADLNDDGVVDGADLGLLLAAWGACA